MNLCKDLSDSSVIASLKSCEFDLQKRLRNTPTEAAEDLTAVFHRVKFQRLILQSLVSLFPAKSSTPNELGMAEISKLLGSAAELMPAIKRTVSLGTPADEESKKPR